MGHLSAISARIDKRKRKPAVFSVDREIGIQRQDGVPFMDFRHAYDASIGE
jgi:hypothetical protein